MIDENEKAPRATTLEAKRRLKHDRTPEDYHIGSGTATSARTESPAKERSERTGQAAVEVTGPRRGSHSAVLIAMAARIARGGRP